MRKLRIIKNEKHYSNKYSSIDFKIQVRILFMWFDYKLPFRYSTFHEANAHIRKEPNDCAVIGRDYYLFDTYNQVCEIIKKLRSRTPIIYRGDKIVLVFDRHTMEEVYVNKSYSCHGKHNKGYEYASTLDGLKKLIDDRKFHLKTQVIEA